MILPVEKDVTDAAAAVAEGRARGYSRFRFVGRRPLVILFLTNNMFPTVLLLIPLFTIMRQLKLLYTPASLVLSYTTFTIPFSVWLLMSREIVPTYRGLWQGFLFMALFTVPIYFVDGAFHVNYMYLGNRSNVGILAFLWDRTVPNYGRPGFVLTLGVIILIVLHVFYGVYFLLRKPDKKDGSALPG